MSKHTPGPWKTGNATKSSNFGDWQCRVKGQDDVGPVTIAKVCSGNGVANDTAEVAEANARLIAAAPDMLTALERLSQGFMVFAMKGWREEVALAKAAIAKATNEQSA